MSAQSDAMTAITAAREAMEDLIETLKAMEGWYSATTIAGVTPFGGNSGAPLTVPSGGFTSLQTTVLESLAATGATQHATFATAIADLDDKIAVFANVPTYTMTVSADPVAGGLAMKSPDQGAYVVGAEVDLTALAASGYEFSGFYDGLTLLSATSPYTYTTTGANKTLTAKFTESAG